MHQADGDLSLRIVGKAVWERITGPEHARQNIANKNSPETASRSSFPCRQREEHRSAFFSAGILDFQQGEAGSCLRETD